MSKKIGFGAYFFPFVTIHVTEVKLKKPQKRSETGFDQRKIVLKHNLPEFEVIATDDGFIGVVTEDTDVAKNFLNVLFAITEGRDVGYQQIANADVIRFVWEEGSENVILVRVRLTRRNYIASDRNNESHNYQAFTRELLHPLDLRNFIDNAIRISKSTEKTDYLLLGEGITLYWADMYKPAFLLGWMVIESNIIQKWTDYVNTISKPDNEKSTLLSFTKWEVSRYSKFLHEIKQITDNEKNRLDKLRDMRNDIIHKKIQTGYIEAWECLSLAYELVTKHSPKLTIDEIKTQRKLEKKEETERDKAVDEVAIKATKEQSQKSP